ncbi:hypothetical protein SAMN04489796_102302 [Winogradskyella thalassocola]|uniref:Uncharacterized protein n=1 Tax=Winogradskyella thalassocola TaxID=262004 RepID=A0A1G8BD71_9FLAO|nr:hypothetical protein SAMN04489796_102302 [Winogradskyella thalassocola]
MVLSFFFSAVSDLVLNAFQLVSTSRFTAVLVFVFTGCGFEEPQLSTETAINNITIRKASNKRLISNTL